MIVTVSIPLFIVTSRKVGSVVGSVVMRFQDAALASAALWSERYLPERKLPDKATAYQDA